MQVIAHRGASADYPENTLAAFDQAVRQGATSIETDVIATADHHLVLRHDVDLTETTTAARGTRAWDLTLAELRELRAVERLPGDRPVSAAYDGRFGIPTLREVLDWQGRLAREGITVELRLDLKDCAGHRRLGVPLEEEVVALLREFGLDRPGAPLLVQCFEDEALSRLAGLRSRARRVKLSESPIEPLDWGGRVVEVGLDKAIVHGDPGIVSRCHRAGLDVSVWTLRAETRFLGPGCPDLSAEVSWLAGHGVDAVFTDHPGMVQAYLAGD